MTVRSMVIGGLILLATAALAGFLLVTFYGSKAATPQLEAIKAASTIVLGAGGAVALILAARRQRSTELTLQENARIAAEHAADRARDLEQRERIADDARIDATERRITDLYTTAANQLGHADAPVRLAGLYALERLAHANLSQRQTIVNVICAYLRMSYEPAERPSKPPLSGDVDLFEHALERWKTAKEAYQSSEQELQVRIAAQTILADHLRIDRDASDPTGETVESRERRWPGVTINLRGAYLERLDFSSTVIPWLDCTGARFIGRTSFSQAEFGSHVKFSGARFAGTADFSQSSFQDTVSFFAARFEGEFDFRKTVFTYAPYFHSVAFNAPAPFIQFRSDRGLDFDECTFHQHVNVHIGVAPHVRFNVCTFESSVSVTSPKVEDVQFIDSRGRQGATLPSGWRWAVAPDEDGYTAIEPSS